MWDPSGLSHCHCCGVDLIPGSRTSTCNGYSKKKKKKKKKVNTVYIMVLLALGYKNISFCLGSLALKNLVVHATVRMLKKLCGERLIPPTNSCVNQYPWKVILQPKPQERLYQNHLAEPLLISVSPKLRSDCHKPPQLGVVFKANWI